MMPRPSCHAPAARLTAVAIARRGIALLIALWVTIAACARPLPLASQANDRPPSASSSADFETAKPGDDDLDKAGAKVTSWTDPRVIRALARDCRFDPTRSQSDDPGIHPHPLSCATYQEQSCVHDPCDGASNRCKCECKTTCRSCSQTCMASCQACVQSCRDARCRLGCATTCGQCHQDCLRSGDRCRTGKCVQEDIQNEKTCRIALRDRWRKNRCKQKCVPYVPCVRRCFTRFEWLLGDNGKSKDFEKDYERRQACYDRCEAPDPEKKACLLACQGPKRAGKRAAADDDVDDEASQRSECEEKCQPACDYELCPLPSSDVRQSFRDMQIFGPGGSDPESWRENE